MAAPAVETKQLPKANAPPEAEPVMKKLIPANRLAPVV
jgi:hypothetical protein